MLAQEITIQITHPDYHYSRPELRKQIKISHNNTINRLWYNLYRIDKIIFTDDPFHKAIDILEELLDDNNNYLEYTKCNLLNPFSSSENYSGVNNYFDFQDYIIEKITNGRYILLLQ